MSGSEKREGTFLSEREESIKKEVKQLLER